MKTNEQRAADTVGCLLAHQIADVVICAGARNAPLIRPILEQESIRVWRHFDERSAAFFALGLAKKEGKPVALVTTSGTAAAELLPATIEAYYSGIPLLLITADRPARFRGSGAPQAIEQVRLFGGYASFCEDPIETLSWEGRGPIHLNLCLEEPKAPTGDSLEPAFFELERSRRDETQIELPEFPKHTIAIVGELPGHFRADALTFLQKLNVPTWCEATSGLREASGVDIITDEAAFSTLDCEMVIRIGGVPSLRFWRDLETRGDIKVINLTHTGFSGLARDSTTFTIQEGWVDDLTLLDRPDKISPNSSRPEIEDLGPEERVIRKLSEIIPSDALLFLGNSLPIREWNRVATTEIPHSHCFANRGANGIDGELATWFGLSEGEAESWAILGDLTTLYDLNAPWVLDQLGKGKRRIVVINNGGGKIFSKLPSMKDFSDDEKFISENHHRIRFEHWAAMWGMAYISWDGKGDFPETAEEETVVIEVVVSTE